MDLKKNLQEEEKEDMRTRNSAVISAPPSRSYAETSSVDKLEVCFYLKLNRVFYLFFFF